MTRSRAVSGGEWILYRLYMYVIHQLYQNKSSSNIIFFYVMLFD